jgi:hypothetical protein
MLRRGSIHYRTAATMMAAAAPAILRAPVGRGAPPVKVLAATGELEGLTLVKVVGAGGGGAGAEVTGTGGGAGALVTGTGGGAGGAVVSGTGTLLQSSQ